MMDIQQRIAQFETMVRPEADPNNDMAWFSLAGAYVQAARHADAAYAYIRCYEINPGMSKAYQLAGKALIESGDTAKAIEVLTAGYISAAAKGDFMPKNAMGELLTQLNAPVPIVETKSKAPVPSGDIGDGSFICAKTNRPGTRMLRPPFKGPTGQWIFDHISQQTFDEWIRQGTKVINELRLDLSREEDSATYDRHMREYLGVPEEPSPSSPAA